MLIMLLTALCLPHGHVPDTAVCLRPRSVVRLYGQVLANRQFCVYAIASGFGFAGLFAYVAGSPIIFLTQYQVTPHQYSMIFALMTGGFIASNQANIWLHRRFGSETVARNGLLMAFALAIALVGVSLASLDGLVTIVIMLVAFLFSIGLTSPNSAALALAPFSTNAGTAAAMLGFLQMGIGAVVSSGVGILGAQTSFRSSASSSSRPESPWRSCCGDAVSFHRGELLERTELAHLVVGECLLDLGIGVHDERSVSDHRLIERLA